MSRVHKICAGDVPKIANCQLGIFLKYAKDQELVPVSIDCSPLRTLRGEMRYRYTGWFDIDAGEDVHTLLSLDSEGMICGMLTYEHEVDGDNIVHVITLTTREGCSGHGRILLESVLGLARECGARAVQLCSMKSSVGFYLHHGMLLLDQVRDDPCRIRRTRSRSTNPDHGSYMSTCTC